MMLLTKLNLVNKDCHTKAVLSKEIVAIDPWSVIMVTKMSYDDGVLEGSKVYIAEGVGAINVEEVLTDVVHIVEQEIKSDADI